MQFTNFIHLFCCLISVWEEKSVGEPPAGDGNPYRKGREEKCFTCEVAESSSSLSRRIPAVVYCLHAAERWLLLFYFRNWQLITFQHLDAAIFGHKSTLCYVYVMLCLFIMGKLLVDIHTHCNVVQCDSVILAATVHRQPHTQYKYKYKYCIISSKIRIVTKTIPQSVVIIPFCISDLSLIGEMALLK